MKIEYSKKIEANKDTLKKIKKLDSKKLFDEKIITEYFDFKDNSLTKNGKLLRLRKEGNKNELAFKEKTKFKGYINKTILNENIKIISNSYEDLKKILLQIGLIPIRNEIINRKEFLVGKVKIELNDNKILEIESSNKKQLLKVIERLK